jgi:nicotinamide riboside transporter PnuC
MARNMGLQQKYSESRQSLPTIPTAQRAYSDNRQISWVTLIATAGLVLVVLMEIQIIAQYIFG